jgi:hypothetical protein
MSTDYSFVTQSKYYSPVFNAALFDGPLRLYFAQSHEADALKLYFQIQDILGSPDLRKHFKGNNQCLFVMIYPSPETFDVLFGGSEEGFEVTKLDHSPLIGVRGPLTTESIDRVVELILKFIRNIPLRPEREAVVEA